MRFTVELGPGLEFIAVSGPEVKEYQTEHEGGPPGSVSLSRASAGCRHPCISRPARPGALLGAMERARHASPRCDLDRRHHDSSCRPLARCTDRTAGGNARWPARARTGRRAGSRERGSCVRGQIGRSGRGPRVPSATSSTGVPGTWPAAGRPGAPELECQLIGVGGRGPTRELSIELPPTWVPDRVRRAARTNRLRHPAIQADGSTRLHVLLPGGEDAPEGRALEIAASSTAAGGRGSSSCRESVPPVLARPTRPGWPWWTGR